MRKALIGVLLGSAVALPLAAQTGLWVTSGGSTSLRANTTGSAVSIRQDGSGPVLELFLGDTSVMSVGSTGCVGSGCGIGTVSDLPATCTVGQVVSKTTATAGVYFCEATDTWVLLEAGIGSGDALTANPLSQFASTTSAQFAGVISNETGTGVVVLATSPTLVTPVLGVATATSINKVALTAPATAATLTIADGKTLTASNTLTFTGTDSSSVAFGTGGTVTYTANTLAVFAATTSAQLAGVLSNETGTGLAVFNDTPTLATPAITGAISLPDNVRQTFNPGADAAGLNVGAQTADPGTPSNGDLYYDSDDHLLRARINGAWVSLGSGSGDLTAADIDTSAELLAIVTDETGTGALVFGTGPTISSASLATPTIVGAMILQDGVRQTFNPDGTTPGLNVGAHTSDPASATDGDIFYDSDDDLLRVRINGAWATVATGSAGCTVPGSDTQLIFNDGGSCGADAGLVFNKTTNALTITGAFTAAGYREGMAAKVADATLSATESFVVCDATGGTVTLTLPTAAGIMGRAYTVKKIDSTANACVIEGSGAETVDGDANQSIIVENESITVTSDNTNFVIKSGWAPGLVDPGADRILFWRESENAVGFLTLSGCSITTTVLTCAGGGDALVADGLDQFAATTSAELKGVLSDELGDASGKVIFALGTLAIASGKTLTASNTLTFTGTDSSTVAFGAGGTVLYADSTATLTNRTINAESTGNVITLPFQLQFNAGVCQNATASAGGSAPTTLGAAANCHSEAAASGDPAYGDAVFPAGGDNTEWHDRFELPSDWTGAIDVTITWHSPETDAGDVVWTVAFGCVAAGEDAESISYNATNFSADANETGGALRLNKVTATGITTTGCAASETAFFKIMRDTDTAGDTLDEIVHLLSVGFTYRRAM